MTLCRIAPVLLAAVLPALPVQAQTIPALTCRFDRACTSETDCTAADLVVTLTPGAGDEARLAVEGKGERPAQTSYVGGTLTAAGMLAEIADHWMLTLPKWPAENTAAFAEVAPLENRITAWLGTCAVAEPAE